MPFAKPMLRTMSPKQVPSVRCVSHPGKSKAVVTGMAWAVCCSCIPSLLPRRGMFAVYAAPMRPDDDVRVRPAAPDDAGELARLRWEHCLELWDRPPEAPPDRSAFEEEFRRFLFQTEP